MRGPKFKEGGADVGSERSSFWWLRARMVLKTTEPSISPSISFLATTRSVVDLCVEFVAVHRVTRRRADDRKAWINAYEAVPVCLGPGGLNRGKAVCSKSGEAFFSDRKDAWWTTRSTRRDRATSCSCVACFLFNAVRGELQGLRGQGAPRPEPQKPPISQPLRLTRRSWCSLPKPTPKAQLQRALQRALL